MVGRARSVLVAMSGGVDSSVAAAVLLRAGYDVTGVFLCLSIPGAGDASHSTCCSPKDAEDARRVADDLGIRLFVHPAGGAFEWIVNQFASEYARGRTPNPCIHCNSRIKFGLLFDVADACGIRYVATGHYARIASADGASAIARAANRRKDQSYALFAVNPDRLDRVLFPIGEFGSKGEVRDVARMARLNVHDKPDSQELCFIPGNDHASWLRERAPHALRPGKIVDSGGVVLGEHDGYGRFTIGQRRGVRVAAGSPLYVTRIDPDTAVVTVGPREALLTRVLSASGAVWHRPVPQEFDAVVQIRYGHAGAGARVRITGEGSFSAQFAEPLSAVTPGQAAVVYRGDILLGGGWIDGPVGLSGGL